MQPLSKKPLDGKPTVQTSLKTKGASSLKLPHTFLQVSTEAPTKTSFPSKSRLIFN